MAPRHLPHLQLALAIALAGCTPPATTPKPKASSPTTASASTQALLGLGGARLGTLEHARLVTAAEAGLDGPGLINNGGSTLIGNDGASIISTDGSSLITNDGGSLMTGGNSGTLITNDGAGIGGTVTAPSSLITNDGGSLITNDGGSIVAQGGGNAISDMGGLYRLAQAASRPVKGAYVYLRTADGRFVTDAKGSLLATRTNAQGRYGFPGVVARRNLEVYVALGALKGEAVSLQAFLTHDRRTATTNLDAFSALGAAYVLDKIVAGQPDPRASLDRLTRQLDADTNAAVATALGTKALAADQLTRAAATQDVVAARDANAPLAQQLEVVRQALTLGQAGLANGLPANQVSLLTPRGLALLPDGGFCLAEAPLGRIRKVDANGRLTTIVDHNFGLVKENYLNISKLVAGPAGELYVASLTDGRVRKITPDGKATLLAGNGVNNGAAVPGDALTSPLVPNALALSPDGKRLFIGEGRIPGFTKVDGESLGRPRAFELVDGKLVEQPIGQDSWTYGAIQAMLVGPDGSLYVQAVNNLTADGEGGIYRQLPDGTVKELGRVPTARQGDMALAPDGTLYFSNSANDSALLAIKADGTRTLVAGAGAPGAAADLIAPGAMALRPDGTLLVVDVARGEVRALAPSGAVTTLAGSSHVFQGGTLTGITINGPSGADFDEQDRLLVSEFGTNTVVRFDLDQKRFDTIAGTVNGFGGDGGPATQARFSRPGNLRFRDGMVYLIDASNKRLRRFPVGGNVETLAGTDGAPDVLTPGTVYAPDKVSLQEGTGLTLDAAGIPYWTRNIGKQVARLIDGHVELVAGAPSSEHDINLTALIGIKRERQPATDVPLGFPSGLVTLPDGSMLLADGFAGTIYRLRDPGPGATLEPFAGIGPSAMLAAASSSPQELPNDEGKPATQATLYFPTGMAVDTDGTVYVAEAGTANFSVLASNFSSLVDVTEGALLRTTGRIRRIAPDGTITTIAGPGSRYFDHPNSPEEELVLPSGLALSRRHGLAILDTGANLVHVLPPEALTGGK